MINDERMLWEGVKGGLGYEAWGYNGRLANFRLENKFAKKWVLSGICFPGTDFAVLGHQVFFSGVDDRKAVGRRAG